MSKRNLPNIPIYIGDWERDCNVLSLESEAAWMRIVFKLWTKGKQNSIKMPAKALQNLWRCDANKMREILDDLIFNEICDIVESERFVEFTCRRFVKENELSEIRSNAAKSKKANGKQKANSQQKSSKIKSKVVQNTDYDYDYENENENESKGKGESREPSGDDEPQDLKYTFSAKRILLADDNQVWMEQLRMKQNDISDEDWEHRLTQFDLKVKMERDKNGREIRFEIGNTDHLKKLRAHFEKWNNTWNYNESRNKQNRDHHQQPVRNTTLAGKDADGRGSFWD